MADRLWSGPAKVCLWARREGGREEDVYGFATGKIVCPRDKGRRKRSLYHPRDDNCPRTWSEVAGGLLIAVYFWE